jgi:prepilin-type N-terminal cleavage/methylation domain-containing protein
LIKNYKFKIKDNTDRGFTIIEMLVIIGIISLISAILIVYIRAGGRQIVLFREQAKLVSVLARAKYLAISTFGREGVPCGYGVHFTSPRTFLIFKDLADNCQSSDQKYSGSLETQESFELDSLLEFETLTFSDILFIPPDPSIVINPTQDEATLIIKAVGSEDSAVIKINSAGQIGI